MLIRTAIALLTLCILAGCQSARWAESFVAMTPLLEGDSGPLGYAPIEKTDLLLVDFDEATRDRSEADHRAIGYANFTGTYSRRVERDLRVFAVEIGADFVAWGARYMHNELHTSYQTVFDTYTSRTEGRRYNPRTGKYDTVNRTRTTTVARTVPVTDDHAIYAFRAVFYRSDDRSSRASSAPVQ